MVEEKRIDPVAAIRGWMTEHTLDAYLVPHADRFQSEYMPARDERLAWATGFTGSAGMAAILKEHAALFTDGRYTLQAPMQVKTDIFTVVESPPARPIDFLVQHIPDKGVIGFDPWLLTVAQLRQWKASSKDHQWDFKAIAENPIDRYWHDRPVEELHEAFLHDVAYAGKSRTGKIADVLAARSDAAGSVLVTDPTLVCWLLNIRGRDVPHIPVLLSMALVQEDGTVILFTDTRKITQAMQRPFDGVVVCKEMDDVFAVLKEQTKPVQLDPAQCPVALHEFCVENKIAVLEFTDPCIALRAIKTTTEIEGAKIAHDKDAAAFVHFMKWFRARDFKKETISEKDIVAKLYECRAKDADFIEDSFGTIAGFAGNGAIVHYKVDDASNATLKPDSLLLLDSGGQYPFGTTDITRTFAIGTPNALMKKHYTAVLQGLIALSSARFPEGVSGAQLDVIARQALWAHGVQYSHGTGHGVGSFLSVHEGPQGFSPRGVAPLREGMILSIEPGVYIQGQYGIRLENLVVVVGDTRNTDMQKMMAFRTLTTVPFESDMIAWDVLSAAEIAWLKNFKTVPRK